MKKKKIFLAAFLVIFIALNVNAQESTFNRLLSRIDLNALEIGVRTNSNFSLTESNGNEMEYLGVNSEALIRYNLPWRSAIKLGISTFKFENNFDSGWIEAPFVNRLRLNYEYHFSDFNIYNAENQTAVFFNTGIVTDFIKPTAKKGLGLDAGIGIKFKISTALLTSLEVNYTYFLSDDLAIDNKGLITSYTGNDSYFFMSVSMTYKITRRFTRL
jgi:hypothetical protein